MTETDDIVARLKQHAEAAEYLSDENAFLAAAAHITRLEERCAALEGQVKDGAAEIEWLKIRVQTLAETNFNGVLHSTRDRAEAAEREAAALKEEVGRLRETLEKADTPNQFWSWEDPESGGPDLDYVMDDCPHDGIEHLLCGRSLPDRWGAFRCLTVDEDGDPEETVIETFATKEQAERCWPESLAAARAALQPQEPKLNIGGGDE